MAQGRYISWEDDRRRRNVAFIGDLVRERLFGEKDPIALRILHNRFHQLLRDLVARTPLPTGVKRMTVDTLEPALALGALSDVRSQVDRLLEGGAPTVPTLLVMEERVISAISRLPEA